jgi:hypothetical protein
MLCRMLHPHPNHQCTRLRSHNLSPFPYSPFHATAQSIVSFPLYTFPVLAMAPFFKLCPPPRPVISELVALMCTLLPPSPNPLTPFAYSLNIESDLQSLFGLISEGAIGQPRQTTSLCDPLPLRISQLPHSFILPPPPPSPPPPISRRQHPIHSYSSSNPSYSFPLKT